MNLDEKEVEAGTALAGVPGLHSDNNPTLTELEKFQREIEEAGTNPELEKFLREVEEADVNPELEQFQREIEEADTNTELDKFLREIEEADTNNYGGYASDWRDAPRIEAIQGVGAQTLMEKVLVKPVWLVKGLLSTSCACVLASPPKYGKSFLALQLGHSVATGTPFLGHETTRAPVLYLALEDVESRVQTRLWGLADESTDDFVIATHALTLGSGLVEQLEDYLEDYPGTKLFIIDTLQVARDVATDYSYSSDYADMRKLKSFSDEHGVCVLVLTHLRKLVCPGDSFANITGTTGISGAVDTMMVLQRDSRHDAVSTMDITGRDIPDTLLKLRRNGTLWELVEEVSGEELEAEHIPECVKSITRRVTESGAEWFGSATELIECFGIEGVTPAALGKLLTQHRDWMGRNGVAFSSKRSATARTITLKPTATMGDGHDGGDGDSASGATTISPSGNEE